MCDGECVPAIYTRGKKAGQYASRGHGAALARLELTKRDGPEPFSGAVCRHLPECKNDSMAPNGFVCTLHTVWDTQKQNMNDRSEQSKRKFAREGGKKNVESGHLQNISSLGGKKVSSIVRTCQHCGKTISGAVYFRWHGDNCKSRAVIEKNYIQEEEDEEVKD